MQQLTSKRNDRWCYLLFCSRLLAAKVHMSLVDLEDHMDDSTKDFTNAHMAAAVTLHSK